MPFLKLKELMVTPSGGWRMERYYPESRDDLPPDRRYILGGDFQDLCSKVVTFRIINNLPLGNPEEEIQDWICRHTEAPCKPAAPRGPLSPSVKASGGMVARWLKAMAAWMVVGGFVDQATAEKRAETCAGCRWQARLDDAACFGCFGLTEKIMQVIGQRKTRFDDALQFCGRCGCSNKISAFVPLEVLGRAHKLEDFKDIETGQFDGDKPAMCWKGEGL